jgi:hypothetical protein
MSAQTIFRPQLHGFDFNNTWDVDDNYRNFIKAKVNDALPIAAKAIATNPVLGPTLLGMLGSAYGVGEFFLPGAFDTIAIPIIISQIVQSVKDKLEAGSTDDHGACGGMAFAPLDYFYNQWMIPKGIFPKTIDGDPPVTFIVPPIDIPDAKILRDYIYKRFEDTWDSGGVLDKMLQ